MLHCLPIYWASHLLAEPFQSSYLCHQFWETFSFSFFPWNYYYLSPPWMDTTIFLYFPFLTFTIFLIFWKMSLALPFKSSLQFLFMWSYFNFFDLLVLFWKSSFLVFYVYSLFSMSLSPVITSFLQFFENFVSLVLLFFLYNFVPVFHVRIFHTL